MPQWVHHEALPIFCGKSVHVELFSSFDAGALAFILCEPCGARGPSVYVQGEERWHTDEAIARAQRAWDKRALDNAQDMP
jgi:hypothetical protein